MFLCVLSVLGGCTSCIVSVYWCLSLWWVLYVYALCMFSSLLCLRLLCAVLYLVPVRVVVLLLVGVSGFIGVCVRPLCMCLLRLLYFSLVCLSLSCGFL